MNEPLSIAKIMKYLRKEKSLTDSGADFEALDRAIRLERETNGERTHRMTVLKDLRSFQLQRVLDKLAKPCK